MPINKILLTTYSTAFLMSGGSESELVQVAEMLNNDHFQTDVYGIKSRPLHYYDRVMHFSLHADGDSIIREVSKYGAPIMLWPHVWWTEAPSAHEVSRIESLINHVDHLVFNSDTELAHFCNYLQVDRDKCFVIPHGISGKFLQPYDVDLLQSVCDVTDYAVCPGLIEPVKNQLELIRALNQIGMNGLFIGGYRDRDYFLKCQQEAHPGIHFLPFIQPCSALLRAAVGGARLLVEPSYDPPGRSCIEGAFLRKPLIMLDGDWQREHFFEHAWYSDNPGSSAIAQAIRTALGANDQVEHVDALHDHVTQKHSPERITSVLNKIMQTKIK